MQEFESKRKTIRLGLYRPSVGFSGIANSSLDRQNQQWGMSLDDHDSIDLRHQTRFDRYRFLLIENSDFETAVGSANHSGAVAGQGRTDEQRAAGDGCPRITGAVANRVGSGVVVAAEIGQEIASSGGDRVDKDRDSLPRGRRDDQAGRNLRAVLDSVGRVNHGAVWRDGHALEIGQVLINRRELQGVGLADRDGLDEGHPDRDGLGIRGGKADREQQPHGGDVHARYPAITGLSQLVQSSASGEA